jgi:type I restriction enzyme M protein
MNTETKRHIDAARQVLVGVVPNPTAQIEQITNALVYKFMDDMDQKAIKVGGEPAFFVDDLEPYAWTRIIDSRIGNQERMNLYSEALLKFSQAKQLPELFRNIFRQAFLPYRSPETLGLFLKEIDYFDYSHPEELGNAYEYLLSIMSSQGDAGQFRTPRHIIDFIVGVVNPTKEDKILDPACGTGGFLISSFNHILKQHDGKDDPRKKEKPLTPDDRKKLMANFEGYDIDPTMVRISQVNMYLHQFKNPKIFQYDSLSQDERWNDKFDVILANPPFMSPKGGIKPHSKFSIQSSRSEVLFVDYIINHLRSDGRAGIIVPEGIIFQSGTAHKALRKNMIENGLYAVVSLPSGVFAPYSGVKTSILLFNNKLVKKTKDIIFVKIIHDGTDLGAKKRITVTNDLLPAAQVIKNFESGNSIDSEIAHIISKKKIADTSDYNLTGDRYKISADIKSDFELAEIGELIEEQSERVGDTKGIEVWSVSNREGFVSSSELFTKQVASANISNYKLIKPGYFAYNPSRVNVGSLALNNTSHIGAVSPMYVVFSIKNESKLLPKFLYRLLKSDKLHEFILQLAQGAVRQQLRINDLKVIKIPLPSRESQVQIVKELDEYELIIKGAKQILINWKPSFEIDNKWPIVKLGEICERITKGTTPTTVGFSYQEKGINFVKIESIDDYGYFLTDKFAYISEECNKAFKRSQLKKGDILFSIAGALGRVALVNEEILPANTNQALAIISPKNVVDSGYLEQVLRSPLVISKLEGLKVGVAQSNISLTQVSDFEIPIPEINIQVQIVKKIKTEQSIVEANKRMIDIFQKKIDARIKSIWES